MSNTTAAASAPIASNPDPCCAVHADWPTLAQHLMLQFPDLGRAQVIEAVRHAQKSVHLAVMSGTEGLVTGELIARHQLSLLSDAVADGARLDPDLPAERGAAD